MQDVRIYNALNTKSYAEKTWSVNNDPELNYLQERTTLTSKELTIQLDNLKPDFLDISVKTDDRYRSINGNVLYLFIQTHGIINRISTEKINSDITSIRIPKSELIHGINQVTFFDAGGNPVWERFIYTHDKDRQVLNINTDEIYGIREKISLNIPLGTNQMNLAGLSVSVKPVADDRNVPDFEDYMVFGSEFGLFPQKMIRGNPLDDIPAEKLDSLLMLARSNWIRWDYILSGNQPAIKFQVEDKDHFLTGKLRTLDQNAPDTEEYLLLSAPGKVAQFQYARTSKQGDFSFRIPIGASIKDLIIQMDDITKKHKIILESSFSDKYIPAYASVDSAKPPLSQYLMKWKINYQVNKIYESKFTGNLETPLIKEDIPKRFYGKPSIELVMADYIKLPVMEEVFFELLPGVTLRNKKSDYELTITDPVIFQKYNPPPCMLVDGVIIDDPAIFANFDPELVEKIDVVKKKYFVGNYLFYGLVNVITKAGDYSNVELPSYAIRIPYRVFDPVWTFKSPDYSSSSLKNNHTPDFRNTLFWNPLLKPDSNGNVNFEFWTSDVVSDYEIVIEGVTPDGMFISSRKVFRVE